MSLLLTSGKQQRAPLWFWDIAQRDLDGRTWQDGQIISPGLWLRVVPQQGGRAEDGQPVKWREVGKREERLHVFNGDKMEEEGLQ